MFWIKHTILNILLEIILKTSRHSPCLRKFLLFSNGNSMGLEGWVICSWLQSRIRIKAEVEFGRGESQAFVPGIRIFTELKAIGFLSSLHSILIHWITSPSFPSQEGGDRQSEKIVQMVAKPDMTQPLLSEWQQAARIITLQTDGRARNSCWGSGSREYWRPGW